MKTHGPIIEILSETRHPLIIVTESALVERDIGLLAPIAAQGPVSRNCCNHGTRRRHSLLPKCGLGRQFPLRR
jgi:hypothetical protein